jgi:hypothetical protein
VVCIAKYDHVAVDHLFPKLLNVFPLSWLYDILDKVLRFFAVGLAGVGFDGPVGFGDRVVAQCGCFYLV